MRKGLISLILTGIIFVGCRLNRNDDFLDCFSKACEIRYVKEADGMDYWQSPKETEKKGEGDCEDKAFYLEDLLEEKRLEASAVMGIADLNRSLKTNHSWVEYEGNEKWILDPTSGDIIRKKDLIMKAPEKYIETRYPFSREDLGYFMEEYGDRDYGTYSFLLLIESSQ